MIRRPPRPTLFPYTPSSDLDGNAALDERYAEALTHLPPCVLFIDDFGREICKNVSLTQRVYRLYKHILTQPNIHVILTLEPHEYAWLEREFPAFAHVFETIVLKNQTAFEYARVLS